MKLDDTQRGCDAFGSTDVQICQINSPGGAQDNFILSDNPSYGPFITIQYKVKGNHDTLGLDLDDQTMMNRMILLNCKKGTLSSRIRRSQLRGSMLVAINDIKVKTIEDVVRTIHEVKSKTA